MSAQKFRILAGNQVPRLTNIFVDEHVLRPLSSLTSKITAADGPELMPGFNLVRAEAEPQAGSTYVYLPSQSFDEMWVGGSIRLRFENTGAGALIVQRKDADKIQDAAGVEQNTFSVAANTNCEFILWEVKNKELTTQYAVWKACPY